MGDDWEHKPIEDRLFALPYNPGHGNIVLERVVLELVFVHDKDANRANREFLCCSNEHEMLSFVG